ncbi:M48 family metallopeptidase [Primorskyibacter sp. 2E107]|uniref:M48 family metallopeptidase n=1 Tax=Primorskyibacter sp. 2E107 TaxID=3403458 RepID=UPI003AF9D034
MQGTEAAFFDGLSAGRHRVHVALSTDRLALEITGDSLPDTLRWPLQDLRAPRDHADTARLTVMRFEPGQDEAQRHEARLVIEDPDLIAWLHKTRPNLFRRDLHLGILRKLGLYAGGAITAVLLLLFVIIPAMANTLARVIPIEREIAFGQTVTAQMERMLGGSTLGSLRCTNPAGRVALDRMAQRLTQAQDMEYDISLQVLDHAMMNAFAAPGGQIVILRGLLDKAGHPDQVAGVLAHEIGHVESRDATRNALRAAGSAGILTMLLGDFTGGAAIAFVGEHMLNASYTREAEGAADRFALGMLQAAQVDTGGLATFFDLVAQETGEFRLPGYLASHPDTPERAARARQTAETQSDTTPILSNADWQALKRICDETAPADGEDT